MHGANTAELRDIAGRFTFRGGMVLQSASTLRGQIERIDWEGPDRDRFVDEWRARTDRALVDLGDLVERIGIHDLPRQADEQDDASAAAGGTGGAGVPDRGDVESGKSDGERRAHDTRVDDPDRHETVPDEIPNDEVAIDPYDINQQALGDCWALASIAAVAGTDPELLAENVQYDEASNDYLVTLYEDGEPIEVRVDGSFVYNDEAGAYEYAVGDDGMPNYASVYEKAIADHYGESYGDIWGGKPEEALALITGREIETQGFDPFLPWQQGATSDSIAGSIDSGQSVVLTTRNDLPDDSPIVGRHAYTVVDVRDDNSVVLYNPWGANPESGLTSEPGLEPGEVVVPADQLDTYFRSSSATK
ncbi:hypothetical protein GCM10011490_11540 [Pseudoclavibacter endophyticus]|nr:C2 family cysteine protease [Pseudoclavibacter endophyticus]GGA62763.1 hypothetical protein GCM10011490_11540 [Pseudoclavibacter endophyticus]